MSSANPRRRMLRELYGVEFPDALFHLADILQSLGPRRDELLEAMELRPIGPLELLLMDAGLPKAPHLPMILHWRWAGDVPEFFSILMGECDGEHFGLLRDDAQEGWRGVASYLVFDRGPMEVNLSLFDALFRRIEWSIQGSRENIEDVPEDREACEEAIRRAGELKRILRREVEARRLSLNDRRPPGIASNTGLSIVVPKGRHRGLSMSEPQVLTEIDTYTDPTALVEEAMAHAEAGFPGAALQLGRAFWYWGGIEYAPFAFQLLARAYADLGRVELLEILKVHHEHRLLKSVDLFKFQGYESAPPSRPFRKPGEPEVVIEELPPLDLPGL